VADCDDRSRNVVPLCRVRAPADDPADDLDEVLRAIGITLTELVKTADVYALGLPPPVRQAARLLDETVNAQKRDGCEVTPEVRAVLGETSRWELDDMKRRELLAGLGLTATAASFGAVDSAALLGYARPRVRSQGVCRLTAAVPAVRRALFQLGETGNGAGDNMLTLHRQREQLEWAYRLRQSSRYTALGNVLPGVLTQAHDLTISAEGDEKQAAYGMLSEVNHLAASFLKKAGERELAWVAVDRGCAAASLTEDRLLTAASAYRLANLLLSAGHLLDARDVAAKVVDELEGGLGVAAKEYLSIRGALCLKSAVIAARRGDRRAARAFLNEGDAVAERLGEDRNDSWTAFGPTNVAIHHVTIAIELGDAGDALRLARRVNVTRLPPSLLERRSHLLIAIACGHAHRRGDSEAVQALLAAEHTAPEEVYCSTQARDLLTVMLSRERRAATPELRGLAARAGVEP